MAANKSFETQQMRNHSCQFQKGAASQNSKPSHPRRGSPVIDCRRKKKKKSKTPTPLQSVINKRCRFTDYKVQSIATGDPNPVIPGEETETEKE